MLTANTTLQVRTNSTAFLCSHTDELADTILVEHLEGVYLQNLLLQINGEEGSDVVTRVTKGHLCQVVGTEGEEFGGGSDAVGSQSGTRNFNHRTYLEIYAVAHFFEKLGGFGTDYFFLLLESGYVLPRRHPR